MHRLLYFVFNIYKQIVIYRTCVDHQLVNTQNLRGSDLLRWSNGLRLNVGSLIRTVEIEIVNHYVTTKHILTWQAHQKLYLRIRIHSSHFQSWGDVAIYIMEWKRWDWKKLAAHTNDLSSSLNLGLLFQQFYWLFFKVMNLWNAKNFIYMIKSRGHKDP